MPCRAIQNRRVMVESSDKMWSTGEGDGKKPLQYSCLENPMNSMKKQKDMTLKGPWVPNMLLEKSGEIAPALGETLILGRTEGRRRKGWQRMRWLDGITN